MGCCGQNCLWLSRLQLPEKSLEPDELAMRYAEKTPSNARKCLTHVRGRSSRTGRAEETMHELQPQLEKRLGMAGDTKSERWARSSGNQHTHGIPHPSFKAPAFLKKPAILRVRRICTISINRRACSEVRPRFHGRLLWSRLRAWPSFESARIMCTCTNLLTMLARPIRESAALGPD